MIDRRCDTRVPGPGPFRVRRRPILRRKTARVHFACSFLLCLAMAACAPKYDYTNFHEHPPRSIVVVPVMNETTNIFAPNVFLPTISIPLANRGYYVFPVSLTTALFHDLGLPEAGLIQQLPPGKFREYFGADAVLLITIKDWGAKYVIINNMRTIEAHYLLRDTQTGELLWERTFRVQKQASQGGNSLIGALVAAVVDKLMSEALDEELMYQPMARAMNRSVFLGSGSGLPAGPYNSGYGRDRKSFPTKAETLTGGGGESTSKK